MWWPLEEAIDHYGVEFLIGKRVKVHDETHEWGDVKPNDEGTISFFGGDNDGGLAYVDFEVYNEWCGHFHCFDVWIGPGEKPDEVDIL